MINYENNHLLHHYIIYDYYLCFLNYINMFIFITLGQKNAVQLTKYCQKTEKQQMCISKMQVKFIWLPKVSNQLSFINMDIV